MSSQCPWQRVINIDTRVNIRTRRRRDSAGRRLPPSPPRPRDNEDKWLYMVQRVYVRAVSLAQDLLERTNFSIERTGWNYLPDWHCIQLIGSFQMWSTWGKHCCHFKFSVCKNFQGSWYFRWPSVFHIEAAVSQAPLKNGGAAWQLTRIIAPCIFLYTRDPF